MSRYSLKPYEDRDEEEGPRRHHGAKCHGSWCVDCNERDWDSVADERRDMDEDRAAGFFRPKDEDDV